MEDSQSLRILKFFILGYLLLILSSFALQAWLDWREAEQERKKRAERRWYTPVFEFLFGWAEGIW